MSWQRAGGVWHDIGAWRAEPRLPPTACPTHLRRHATSVRAVSAHSSRATPGQCPVAAATAAIRGLGAGGVDRPRQLSRRPLHEAGGAAAQFFLPLPPTPTCCRRIPSSGEWTCTVNFLVSCQNIFENSFKSIGKFEILHSSQKDVQIRACIQ